MQAHYIAQIPLGASSAMFRDRAVRQARYRQNVWTYVSRCDVTSPVAFGLITCDTLQM